MNETANEIIKDITYIDFNELMRKIDAVTIWTNEQKSKCKTWLMKHGLDEMIAKTDIELKALTYDADGNVKIEESLKASGFNIEYTSKKNFDTGEITKRPQAAKNFELYGADLNRLVELGFVDYIPSEWLQPYYYAQIETVYKYELKSDILGEYYLSLGRKGFAYSMSVHDVAVNVTWSLGLGLKVNVDEDWFRGLEEALHYISKIDNSVSPTRFIFAVCAVVDDMLSVLLEDEVFDAVNDYLEKSGAKGGNTGYVIRQIPYDWAFRNPSTRTIQKAPNNDGTQLLSDNGKSFFELVKDAEAHMDESYDRFINGDNSYFISLVGQDAVDSLIEQAVVSWDEQKRNRGRIRQYLATNEASIIEKLNTDLKTAMDAYRGTYYQFIQNNNYPRNYNECFYKTVTPDYITVQGGYGKRASIGKIVVEMFSHPRIAPIYDATGNPLSLTPIEYYLSGSANGYIAPIYPEPTVFQATGGGYSLTLITSLFNNNLIQYQTIYRYQCEITFYEATDTSGDIILVPGYKVLSNGIVNTVSASISRAASWDYVRNYLPDGSIDYVFKRPVTSSNNLQTDNGFFSGIIGTFPRAEVNLPTIPIAPTNYKPVNPEPIPPDSDPDIPSPVDDPKPNQPGDPTDNPDHPTPDNPNPDVPPKEDPDMTDDGITPDNPDVLPGIGFNIFRPDDNEMKALLRKLWSKDFFEKFNKAMDNPFDAIISLHTLYALPSTGADANIYLGNYNTNVSATTVTNRYVTINCGSIGIAEFFNDIRDYAPYTNIQLFLPFVGFVTLDTNSVMNSTLVVTYRVDACTGSCLAEVRVVRGSMSAVLYSYEGNCAVSIPLTGMQYSNYLNSVFSAVGGTLETVAGMTTGNVGAIGGGIGSLASAYGSSLENHATKTGNFSSNALAMASRIPYVIIDRTRAYDTTYSNDMGYATNTRVRVGDVTGFLRAHDVHVPIISATDEEKSMIKNLLETGVIV